MEKQLLEGISYALPALVTGGVAYFIFSGLIKHDNNDKKLTMLMEKKKDSLPMKLQAYERLLLFCERINPTKLLTRVQPVGNETENYLILLNATIEQEFEHNLTQQLYVSDECWTAVVASKLAIINKMKELSDKYNSASEFRENAMVDFSKIELPTETAISFIKKDVRRLT